MEQCVLYQPKCMHHCVCVCVCVCVPNASDIFSLMFNERNPITILLINILDGIEKVQEN